jgi:energy-coupling factor transporter ATP-binding protein EcfA2
MTRNYSLHSHYPGLELGTLFYHPTDISFSDQTPRNDPIAFQLRVDSYDQKSSRTHLFSLRKFSARELLDCEPLLQTRLKCSIKDLTNHILSLVAQQHQSGGPQTRGVLLEQTGFTQLSNNSWCALLGRELIGCPFPFACAPSVPDIELLPNPDISQEDCVRILLHCPGEVLLGLSFLMLTSVRSLLNAWDIPFQGVLFLTGRQGMGKTTLAKQLFLVYRHLEEKTPVGIVQASSTNASQLTLLQKFRDIPLVVDDLCLSTSKSEERKRQETGAQLIRLGSSPIPTTKQVGNQTVNMSCQAGVILTAEYAFSSASDVTRCIMLPLKEQLTLPEELSPSFCAFLLRQFTLWVVKNTESLKEKLLSFLHFDSQMSEFPTRMSNNYLCLRAVFHQFLVSLNTSQTDIDTLTDRLSMQIRNSLEYQRHLLQNLRSTKKQCNLSAILCTGKKEYFSLGKSLNDLEKYDGIMWKGDLCLRRIPLVSFVQKQPGYQKYNIRQIVQELSRIDALVTQGDDYTVSLGKKKNQKKAPRLYRIRMKILKKTAHWYSD